jgi:hypothetical protein
VFGARSGDLAVEPLGFGHVAGLARYGPGQQQHFGIVADQLAGAVDVGAGACQVVWRRASSAEGTRAIGSAAPARAPG